MTDDLPTALNRIEIRLNRYTAGASSKVPCPHAHRCGARNERDRCLSVTIDDDGRGARWRCHRASCGGWEDGLRLVDEPSDFHRRRPKVYRRPPEPMSPARTDRLYDWLAARDISRDVADHFGIHLVHRYFSELGGEADALAFPYRRRGELVNVKYRAMPQKAFTQEKDAEKTFFGLDDLDGFDWCVIVEGELDVLAFHVAGITNVISVPDGAPIAARDGGVDPEDDAKFSYVWNCRAELDRMKRIVLAVDNDGPGRALEEELSRRLGRERIYRVRWPDELANDEGAVKDANDALLRCGAELLHQAIAEAEPWPIKDLFRAHDYRAEVLAAYHGKRAVGLSTGLPSLDELMKLPGTGMLVVITGIPGHGKSEFVDQVAINMAELHEWRTAFVSFETSPERHIANLAEKRLRMPFHEGLRARMGEGELVKALDWIDARFFFIVSDAKEPATIDWILETARVAVMRYGIKLLVIDPYNRLEHQRPERMTETEYVAGMLAKVERFAHAHAVDVAFIAHPFKLAKENAKEPVPQLSDISGSVHWYNMADFGLVVWRDRKASKSTTLINMRKVKWKDLGKEGTAEFAYDRATGVYSELKPPPPPSLPYRDD